VVKRKLNLIRQKRGNYFLLNITASKYLLEEIIRKMINRNKIYHDLGFSIRKVNKDEIEIKNSTFDGY